MKKLNGVIPGMIIHCPTRENAEVLRDWLARDGYKNVEYLTDAYHVYGSNTCYEIGREGINYFNKEYWSDGGMYICEFEDLDLEDHEPDLTAEDVIEWFGENYNDEDVMKDTFGADYAFYDLVKVFSAEAIIQKIVGHETKTTESAPMPALIEQGWHVLIFDSHNKLWNGVYLYHGWADTKEQAESIARKMAIDCVDQTGEGASWCVINACRRIKR